MYQESPQRTAYWVPPGRQVEHDIHGANQMNPMGIQRITNPVGMQDEVALLRKLLADQNEAMRQQQEGYIKMQRELLAMKKDQRTHHQLLQDKLENRHSHTANSALQASQQAVRMEKKLQVSTVS